MMTHSPQIGSSSNPLEILTQCNNSSCDNGSNSGVLQNNNKAGGSAQHIDLLKKDHLGSSHLVIQVEEPQYFSPKNFPQQQRKRTDSNGYFYKSHAHLMASHGGNSTNTQIHMNFGEQPPFYQSLAGQNQTNLISQLQGTSNTNQNDQISVMANAGAISVSHGSSSFLQFNSNLINMEPFSTQHISQSASVAHSNMQSPKGSCNSDDSLSASPSTHQQPFTTQSHIPHFPGTFRHIESTLSVFSRQSTNMFKSTRGMIGGGVTTSASIACNESGPIRNRDYSHIGSQWVGPLGLPSNVNAVAQDEDIGSKEYDDLEFIDESLDNVKMPVLQINIQNLQNNLISNLKPKQEEKKEALSLPVVEVSTSPSVPVTYDSNDSPSPYHQDSREQNEVMNSQASDENDENFTLTHSISSTNLVIPSNLGQPLTTQNSTSTPSTLVLNQVPSQNSQSQSLDSQQTYHTLSIQPTIWSAQVPAQTNQEFLFTQSQMMVQYQQNNIPPQIDIQPHQITLSITPHVGGNNGSGVAAISSTSTTSGAQVIQSNNNQTTPISRMGISQTNYVENQNMVAQSQNNIGQFDVNGQQSSAALFKQTLDIMGAAAAAAVQHAQDSLNPQVIHQQFQGTQQQTYQSEIQPPNIVIPGPPQHHTDQLQQQQTTQQQQIAISQIINSQMSMNGGPAIQPQQINLNHFVGSPQIQQPRQTGLQQLTQQDIIEAQMMSNPQQQIYHQLQQQLDHRQSYSQKSQIDPQQQIEQAYQLQQSFNDDPFNLRHYKHNMQISNSYLNRQINRYMQNPLSKTKDFMQDTHHKIAQQSSFRANSSSPELLLQFRPPPGYEHVVPTKVLQQLQPLQLNQQQQLLLEQQMQIQDFGLAAYQLQQHQQQQQQAAATNAQQWQQLIKYQQQVQQHHQHQYQQHQMHQQHQQQKQLDPTSTGSMMDPYLIQQHLQQQQQQQHQQNLQEFNKYFFNFGHMPQNNQVYMSFYDAQNLSKLEEQMRQTAQHLDHKLQENMEIQQERLSDDQLFLEDEQQILMVNNSINTNGQQTMQTTYGVMPQQQQMTQGGACIPGPGSSSNSLQQQLQQQIGLIQQQPQINGTIIPTSNATILAGDISHVQTSVQTNTQRFISENNHNTLSSSSSSLCSKDEDHHQNILNKHLQSSIIDQQINSNSSSIQQQQVMQTEEIIVLESAHNHQINQQHISLSNSLIVNEMIDTSSTQDTNLLSNRNHNHRSSTQNRDHKETKEKIEAFQKLREQLAKIKNELFYNSPNEASTSASGNGAGGLNKNLTPFKCDPSNYFEKLLNLLRIINEVDNNNNIALLRNEHEKAKSQLERVKGERKKANNELSQLQIEMREAKAKIQDLTQEMKEIQEKHLKEREQHEILIKYSQEQIHKDTEAKESLQARITELTLQLENQKEIQHRLESAFDIPSLNVNNPAGIIPNRNDQEQMKQFKQEYGKKMMEYELEINDLREYIKKRAIEAQIIKQADKVYYESQFASHKEAYDNLKKQTDKIIKERDSEIRVLQEKVMSYDPDYFATSTLKECADCKKKDQKLQDADSRIRQYTDYIKSKNDRMISAEKQKELEDEITRLRTQMRELCGPSKQSTSNNNYVKKIEKLMQIILCVQQLNKGQLSPQLNHLIKDMVVIHQLDDSPVIQRLLDAKQIQDSDGVPTYSSMPSLNDSLIDLLTLYLQFPSQPIQPVAPPQLTKSEQEKLLFEKMQFAQDVEVWSKETVKEGRAQREACRQVIIEVEKLMYKMNKELITEQENLEKDSSNPPTMKHNSLIHRIEENKRNSELFSKILEGYLELPHKLKPIFDRQKKYEQMFNKISKADTQLLFEITSQVYDMNRGELQAMREEIGLWQQRCQEQVNIIERQNAEIEKQREKIIGIQGKNVQLKSAYNALEKHFYSIPGGSSKLNQSLLNQLTMNSQTLTKNHSSSSLGSCDSQQMIKMSQNYSSTSSLHEERHLTDLVAQQFQSQNQVNKQEKHQ